MFYLQDPSLLDFQRRFQDKIQKNNLTSVFKVNSTPCDSQFREMIDIHSYKKILNTFKEYFKRLKNSGAAEKYLFLEKYYLISMDGSEYFTSESISCKKCLIKKTREGKIRYHHQILQASIVHPDMKQILPLSPEFIRNSDSGKKKQDCERNAAKRIVEKISKDYTNLPIIIVADSLYSNQSFIKKIKTYDFSFILAAKPLDHKYLYEDIESFRKGGELDTYKYTDSKGRIHLYEWVNEVPLKADKNSIYVNFVEYSLFVNGKRTYHNGWITDIYLYQDNIKRIVKGGRSRWKIENEGFNTLKNHGYHLEHNFGHGQKNLSEAFFVLNLLSFYVHQILELTNILYQKCRAGFSSRKEYWNAIRACFRILLFESWQQVMERMNSPPKPAF